MAVDTSGMYLVKVLASLLVIRESTLLQKRRLELQAALFKRALDREHSQEERRVGGAGG
jgi:hypothetical protein